MEAMRDFLEDFEAGKRQGDTWMRTLLALGGRQSSHVNPVSEHLRSRGLNVTIEAVPYEFQRGGNQMMRVRAMRRHHHFNADQD